MKPIAKKFTRDNPVTKVEIWNTFRGRRGFVRVQVDEAKARIGENAPRYMLRQGRIERVEVKNAEYFRLTEEGKEWLLEGIESFVRNHPDKVQKLNNLPKAVVAQAH